MKLFLLLSFTLLSFITNAQVKYVTQAGAGSRDGSSWSNAYGSQEFADNSYTFTSGVQVWLAGGTYLPSRTNAGVVVQAGDEYNAIFVLNRGVKFYGGFAGTEAAITDRNPALVHSVNQTILSGDFGMPDFNADNSVYVLTMPACGAGEVLDGITVSHALNTGIYFSFATAAIERPVINNCIIRDNSPHGLVSGITMSTGGVPAAYADISNSFFIGNFSSIDGDGAIATSGVRLRVTNCVFYANSSQSFFARPGNCIHFANVLGGEVSNCTFYQNGQFAGNANGVAILLSNVTDSVYINNSIFWKNYTENNVSNIDVDMGTNFSSVKYCIFETQPMFAGPAVLLNSASVDPLFVNAADPDGADNVWGTADDGLALQATSPAVDNGKNEFVAANNTKDILNNERVKGCRVDIGAYEYTEAAIVAAGLYNDIGQSCTAFPVTNTSTVYADSASCHGMVTVTPAGAAPVSGIVQVCVSNVAGVPVYNGVPYVPRHYDIIPANNAANATAHITLYFTQHDFDLYNAAAPGAPQLPTNPTDLAGIANIQIEQNHGLSLTGVPGTYSGTTVYINPDDNDIVWNAANSYWEISFDVNGFSGFFMTTLIVTPVKLTSFTGKKNNETVQLNWQTSLEINTDHFNIEKSSDGNVFSLLGVKPATKDVNGSAYFFTDYDPYADKNFYRLVSVDVNGEKAVSNTILIRFGNNVNDGFFLFPNPAHTQTLLSVPEMTAGKTTVSLFDLNGKKIKELFSGDFRGNSTALPCNVSGIAKGVYVVVIFHDGNYSRKKLVID